MNKKGQFLGRDWVVAVIIFSGIIALGFLMAADFAVSYDNADVIDENIEERYASVTETTAVADSAFSAISSKEGLTLVGAFDILFASGFTVISLLLNSVFIMSASLQSFGADFGIPTQVTAIFFSVAISVISTILVFIVISSTTRRDL